ncbi:MAG: hypothetical protein V4591_07485, partial [Bdellovibrionota bacterium]
MSPITKRKFKIFFSQKRALIGLIIFLFLFLTSICANFISNNKPLFLILSSREAPTKSTTGTTKIYFPILFDYQPEEFGEYDSFIVNYRQVILINHNSRYLFPFNAWNAEEQTED